MKAAIIILLFVLRSWMGHPFDYDLHLTVLPGSSERTLVCFHGYGCNYEIASLLRPSTDATLVSFNFPDHDLDEGKKGAAFGTIDELLPPLYVLKEVVLNRGLDSVDLYGFSAGGGALINVIGLLNSSIYNTELEKIGIGAEEKKRLLSAIQKGRIILDVPLKSIEEIVDFRGTSEEFERLGKNYRENGLRPIDALERLRGLSLSIVLHFQKGDEVLSNRDDGLFIERLKSVQPEVVVIIGDDGGHNAYHRSLWDYLKRPLFPTKG